MSTKKTSSKTEKVTKTVRPIDDKTGYRVGSLGFAIGRAYLGANKHEKAIEAVEEIIKAAAKAKGKPTTEEYVHGRALSWVGFLKARDAKVYQDLPKAEKKVEVKETAKA